MQFDMRRLILSSFSSISLVNLMMFVYKLGGCDSRSPWIGSSLEPTSLRGSVWSTTEFLALVASSGASSTNSTLLFLFLVALSVLEFVIVVLSSNLTRE